jgi:ABC-type transport system substrate-binding protein
MTLIAPGNANLLRQQWCLITTNSFKSVGIDARAIFLDWNTVDDRILVTTPETIGKTFDQGGFDALFLGWTPGSPVTPFVGSYQVYSSKAIPPDSNYMLWNNSESDRLLGLCLTTGYTPQGIEYFKQWQAVQYDDVPAVMLFWQQAVFTAATTLNFNGYQWVFDNIAPVPQYLTGETSVSMAATGTPKNLNPVLSNSWYDTITYSEAFNGLYELRADLTLEPVLATEAPTMTNDGYTFTYKIRTGVAFQDGHIMDEDDILFSWLAYMNPQSGSKFSALISAYVGDDITFKWLNGTETRLVLDAAGNGVYPATNETGTRVATLTAFSNHTVRADIAADPAFGKPYATFHPEGEPSYILPMHFLSTIPFEDWTTDIFNKGAGTYTSNGTTFNGPFGTGAYVFKGLNLVTGLATLAKNENYWNKTALENDGLFTVDNFYIKYITAKDAAIAALKNNDVQILDQNYQLAVDYKAGNLGFATNYLLRGSGTQQLGFNMRHPIFGTGVDTPNGKTDPANAALYAKYVRQAMDYLIPKTLICINLLSGLAEPGAVHVNPASAYYNTALVPRDYNPTAAKALLAKAGYTVGATTPGSVTSQGIWVNEPVVFTGSFIIDPVPAIQQNGIVALLWMSRDNVNWTPVAQTITTAGGYYSLTYTPTQSGLYYFKVELTGVGANTARDSTATGPDFPYYGLPKAITSQTTAVTNATFTTFEQSIAPTTQQITAANAAAANATNMAYAGIGVGIIGILIAIFALLRKR